MFLHQPDEIGDEVWRHVTTHLLLVAILESVADLDDGAEYKSVARLIRVPKVLAKARMDDYRAKAGS